ncbi:MAG: membrane protein insertion efficiency factor YidD [bacterium]
MTRLTVAVIRFYRIVISPLIPYCCRFTPSCSEYAISALEKYGFLRGVWLAFTRVLRCNPFSHGGYDPLT